MSWPNDADGDVFRRLEENGFEFSKAYAVDYNVEFNSWPPAEEALELLRNQFGKIEVCDPDGEGEGYVLFQVTGPVSYEGVTSVQRRVSASLKPFGGTCESWGVLH